MTNHPITLKVASDVRAALAWHKRSHGELAELLDLTPHTVGRRLKGEVPFTVVELLAIGIWLDIDVRDWLTKPTAPVKAAS